MAELFLERRFEPRLTQDDVVRLALESSWCFEMYRVNWHGSLLSGDGSRLLCRFSSVDAESIRQALKKAQVDMSQLWAGTVHEVADPPEPNVAVERTFDGPADLDELQAQEDGHQHCLDIRDVRFARTYFSADKSRMICLYSAPDAESVREAQREAGMPVERVWSFEILTSLRSE